MLNNRLRRSLSRIDYRLLGVLIAMGLLPTIYKTVRIYFLGDLPVDWGYNIASQLTWLSVMYEVVHESLMLPMFFLIGRFLRDRDRFSDVVSNALLLIIALYGLLSIVTLSFARPMVVFMAQRQDLVNATVAYIRLEAIGLILATVVRFSTLVLITLKRDGYLFLVLGVEVLLSILLDTLLLSSLPISLKLGVNGVAITNIIVNTLLSIFLIILVHRNGVRLFRRNFQLDGKWFSDWVKVGGLSGLESLVRNAAFVLMVLRLVNVVQQQGVFWVTNTFIWGWLLVPILALGELVKRDTAESVDAVETSTPAYMLLTAVFVAIWLITIPFWKGFIRSVMGVPDWDTVFRLSLISLVFYVTFAFNNIADSVFYGRGRTDLMLYQSLAVNIVFYGAAFVLYRTGMFVPTLTVIAIMFGLGIAIDSFITFGMFVGFRRAIRKPARAS